MCVLTESLIKKILIFRFFQGGTACGATSESRNCPVNCEQTNWTCGSCAWSTGKKSCRWYPLFTCDCEFLFLSGSRKTTVSAKNVCSLFSFYVYCLCNIYRVVKHVVQPQDKITAVRFWIIDNFIRPLSKFVLVVMSSCCLCPRSLAL